VTRADPPPPRDPDPGALDLKQLRHFLAIVEHGHFGHAAQQLGISKQGISQSVAALEETLGVRLFERGQFGAVPTEFGRALTQYAKVIQAEARKARAEIEGLREEHRGELTIALGSSFSEYIAPAAIRRSDRLPAGTASALAATMPPVTKVKANTATVGPQAPMRSAVFGRSKRISTPRATGATVSFIAERDICTTSTSTRLPASRLVHIGVKKKARMVEQMVRTTESARFALAR